MFLDMLMLILRGGEDSVEIFRLIGCAAAIGEKVDFNYLCYAFVYPSLGFNAKFDFNYVETL